MTMFATGVVPPTYWLPEGISEVSSAVDAHFYFIYWLNVFFFVGITGLLIYFVVKYRRKTPDQAPLPSPSHNTIMELTWSIIPTIVVIALFYVGFVVYQELMTPPKDTYKVLVEARKWNWNFIDPKTGLISTELHVPANTPVELTMTSTDVLHCLYIPVLRTKRDVVPGRYSKMWFNAIKPGEYNIYCAEYCGTEHSEMFAKLVVHKDMAELEQWKKKEEETIAQKPPVEYGYHLYKTRGCIACHSLDGKAGTGPSFLGLWNLADHQVYDPSTGRSQHEPVDENYIRMSVNNPNAKVRQGFGGANSNARASVMPTYLGRFKDERDYRGLIEFIKSMEKEPYKPPAPPVKK